MKFKWAVLYLFVGLVLFNQKGVLAHGVLVGTTFSQVQCEYLGLDWKEAYRATLDMGFDSIRLGAYWYRIESIEGEYNFEELDWQIQLAKEKDVPILLTVGMKAPRWPEYFIPAWLLKKLDLKSRRTITDNDLLQKRVLQFITKTITRYKDEAIIFAWQVENEPLSMAGPKNWKIGKDFLKKEIALFKHLDSEKGRPLIINAMTYSNRFIRFLVRLAYSKNPIFETIDLAQIPAINIYATIGHKFIGKNMSFKSDPQFNVEYVQKIRNYTQRQKKDLWITELQSEPWEPGELVHLGKENSKTSSPAAFYSAFNDMKELNLKFIYLWGVEYGLYRKQIHDDGAWIEAFNKIIQDARDQD